MFHFLLTTGFMFIAPENVASLHSPSEKTKASYQTKARMGKVSLSAHNRFCVHCPQRMSLLSILQTTRPCAVGEQGPASSWGLVKMGIFIYYSK